MQEFLARVRANPGQVSNANAGIGSTNHLACSLFTHLTGARMNEIPYRGEGPALNDIVAQQVDSACLLAPAAVPQIQAGTMRGLLTAATTRNPNAPGVPSAPEAGVPDYIFQGWNAIFAPRGTPAFVTQSAAGCGAGCSESARPFRGAARRRAPGPWRRRGGVGAMTRLDIFVAVLLILGSLALVDSQHKHRRAFIELERAQQAEARLQVEWNQLQLEQSRLAKASLIAEAAERDLKMQGVEPARTLYLSVPLPSKP
jgi:cell division protein FtsL